MTHTSILNYHIPSIYRSLHFEHRLSYRVDLFIYLSHTPSISIYTTYTQLSHPNYHTLRILYYITALRALLQISLHASSTSALSFPPSYWRALGVGCVCVTVGECGQCVSCQDPQARPLCGEAVGSAISSSKTPWYMIYNV